MSRKALTFWLVFLPDAILLYAALFLALLFRYHELSAELLNTHLTAFSALFALWLLVFYIHGLFEAGSFRRYTTLVVNLVSATIVNGLVAILYFYFQPSLILTPRRFLIIDLACSFALLLLWHLLAKYFLKNKLIDSVYLFSLGGELRELEQEIKNHSYTGFRVAGHLSEQSLPSASIAKNSIVILPDNLHGTPGVSAQLYKLRTFGVTFFNHNDFYEFLLRRVYLSQLNELWFLENIDYNEKRFYSLVKRVVDMLLGAVAFLVFVATFPVVAALVRLSSPGSVFFVQERVGKAGSLFKIFKYRTMHGGRTDTWTEKNDPRITKLGNILRKTRLDELPQSINLLMGDISLVGPRPEQTGIVEKLRLEIPFYDERHFVKPGLTGWAQLNIYAGSLEETRLKLQYDLYYVKHRSFLFDLEIILKTIYYIFTWQGR